MGDDIEKINSLAEGESTPAGPTPLDQMAEQLATLAKFASQDHLSLRGSDDTGVEVEPIPSRHSHRSHISNTISRQESKKTYVDFERGDPENPLNFSTARKWFITVLVIVMTTLCAATAGAYSPAIPNIVEEFGVSEEVATL